MSNALGAPEIWVVSCPTDGKPHPDYACSYREGAMEHAAEASEHAPELGPWTVARYVRADLVQSDAPAPLPADAPTFTLPRDSDALIAHIHAAEDAAAPARDALVERSYTDGSWPLAKRLQLRLSVLEGLDRTGVDYQLLREVAAALAQRDAPRAEPDEARIRELAANFRHRNRAESFEDFLRQAWREGAAAPPERSAAQRDDDARLLRELHDATDDYLKSASATAAGNPLESGRLLIKLVGVLRRARIAMQEGQ